MVAVNVIFSDFDSSGATSKSPSPAQGPDFRCCCRPPKRHLYAGFAAHYAHQNPNKPQKSTYTHYDIDDIVGTEGSSKDWAWKIGTFP